MRPITSNLQTLVNCTAVLTVLDNIQRQQRVKKRKWVRSWLARRETKGIYDNLLTEIRLEDTNSFYYYHRMYKYDFDFLLSLVGPRITKQDTRLRKAVAPQHRLSVTLRHLATGESKQSLGFTYRISPTLLSSLIPEVCQALYKVLQPMYLKMPATEEEWRQVQSQFYSRCQFPNCFGSLDGKRVHIAKPPKSGSTYYDYKCQFSLIMMALVDSNLKFLYIDVGGVGRASDGGVWEKCSLKKALESNIIKIPPPSSLPFSQKVCPSVIVADDAFPLKTNLMKPYPGKGLTGPKRIFNYRLSRARRTAENAFGILTAKFRIFKQPINTSPQNVQTIVLAACVLHNFMRERSPSLYAPQNVNWEDHQLGGRLQEENGAIRDMDRTARRPTDDAKAVRDTFMAYFENEGKVHWQDRVALFH